MTIIKITLRLQKVLILLLLSFLCFTNGYTQVCYSNGVTFSSQSQIDLFPSINPGCTIIDGDISIDGADITNLDSLIYLEKIDGNFTVSDNNLTNFNGLNNLDTVAGAFRILNVSTLISFEGLESLKKIGINTSSHRIAGIAVSDFNGLDSLSCINGHFEVNSCANLTSFLGLESLITMGDLEAYSCPMLNSMEGLNNLISMDDLELFNLDALTNLNGLESLETATAIDLALQALTDITGLSSLTSTSVLDFLHCDLLTSLDGLENLNVVNSNLEIRFNDVLNDISAIENADLSDLIVLNISDNPNLSMCSYNSICAYLDIEGYSTIYDNSNGCNGIVEIENTCCIADNSWCPQEMEVCYSNGIIFSLQSEIDLFPIVNPGCKIIGSLSINGTDITNLDSLISLEKIDGNFTVSDNNLTNFNGLNNLDTIARAFKILNGSTLISFEGLESLKKIGINTSSHRIAGIAVSDFNGLDSLSCINGRFEVNSCANLTSFLGLESLITMDDLKAYSCPLLNSMEGLNNLTSMDDLELFNLDALTNLNGLESLETATAIDLALQALTDITGLSSLTSTSVLDFLHCDLLTSLDGLENLNVVNSNLEIRFNDVLNDISAIENADLSNLIVLNISDNPNLSMCSYNSICAYLDIEGFSTIYDNSTGCDGITEIANNCCLSNPIWCPEEMAMCHSNGITFSSQAEIDLFPIVNPGCKIIGSLSINGTDITNLDGLISLEKIDGNFTVSDNNLTNFNGLNNLDTVARAFRILNGSTLISFEGLESLKKIGINTSSHRIAGIGMSDFTGLDSLSCINGRFEVNSCENLTSFLGLESLITMGDLKAYSCPMLNSMEGLNNLTSMDDLELFNLDALTNLNGLESLETATAIDLALQALTDITGLSSLTSTSVLDFLHCDLLTSLDGLENLNVVNSNLEIRFNDVLNDISAIEFTDIKNMNYLSIHDNPELALCNYLNICQYLSDDGFSNIYNNDVGCDGVLEIQYDCIGLLSIFEITPTSGFTENSIDNYWHNPANWRNNMVPVDSSYVIIPIGDFSVIQQDSIANCQILNIQEGATLKTESGGALNILNIE